MLPLSLFIAMSGAPQSCDGLALPPHEPFEHDPPVDCTELQDTGYDAGNAFEITVVTIDDKPVELNTGNAFWLMREAAAADGVDIHIVSGFRTMAEQEYLYMCYQCCCCNNCNLAATPGYSNHQSGHALDLNASAPGVYAWLAANAGAFGFVETVPSENWHWEWWEDPPSGGVCKIATPPQGQLQPQQCEVIRGYAKDPDTPETSIDVHVYFDGPAGDPQATAVQVTADIDRPDICDEAGPCPYGFEIPVPLSLRDGQPHAVHVYGIDSDGMDNAELAASPQQIECDAPTPQGVRRHVPDPATLDAWQLSTFWSLIRLDDDTLAAIDEWEPIEAQPQLVQVPGMDEVWLIDAGWRRHVPDPEVAAAWSFDLSTVEQIEPDELDDYPEGTPVRDAPVLVSGSDDTIYLMDDRQGAGPGGGSGSAGDGDGSGGTGGASETGDTEGNDMPDSAGDDGGCTCRTDARHRAVWAWLIPIVATARRRGS